MKYSLLILAFFSSSLCAQHTNDAGSLKLYHCTILSQGTGQSEIAGVQVTANRVDLVARTKVQVACYFIKADYDTTENNFTILHVYDSTGVIRAAVLSQIRSYWLAEEKRISRTGFFAAGSVNAGFLTHDTATCFPFVKTDHEKDGACFIICVNKNIYKVILNRGTGFGCLSSFLEQNFYLSEAQKQVEFVPTINQLTKIKELLH